MNRQFQQHRRIEDGKSEQVSGAHRHPTEIASIGHQVVPDGRQASISVTGQVLDDPAQSQGAFRRALPGLLTELTQCNPEAQQFVAMLISERAHWITPADLNHFVVPAVTSSLSTITDPETVRRLLSVLLLNGSNLTADDLAFVSRAMIRYSSSQGELSDITLASLALLGDRLPSWCKEPVIGSLCTIITNYAEALESGRGNEELLEPENQRLFELALAGLFAQRNLVTYIGVAGREATRGPEVLDACREAIFALESAAEREHYPNWCSSYQFACTSFIIDPYFYVPTQEAMSAISRMMVEVCPVVSSVISGLLLGDGLTGVVRTLATRPEPEDVPEWFLLVCAFMETAVRFERGGSQIGEVEAWNLDDDILRFIERCRDPILGYFAGELQRALRCRHHKLFSVSE